jgi:peptidoglycan/xylan/chitin deacetylase (PgdA/CDA1 family)
MYKCKFEWPGGAYIAVVFNMSWEIPPSDHIGQVPKAKYKRAMRPVYETAFADTGGMQRLLDMWRRHEIKTSVYADGLGVTRFPDLSREAVADGHEFIVQGWDHGFLYDMTVAEQEQAIDKTQAAFLKELGKTATGFSSAGGHLTSETFEILAKRDFVYSCGLRNAEVPFIIPVGGKKLVGMTSYAVSDTPTMRGMAPRAVVEMWRDYFDALYDEGRRGFPKMLAYGTHPVIAHGHRTRPLEDVIAYVKNREKVWITTRGEIAQWMLKQYPDYDLSKFYPEAVASDRQYGLGIGLGGKEAEDEARRWRGKD